MTENAPEVPKRKRGRPPKYDAALSGAVRNRLMRKHIQDELRDLARGWEVLIQMAVGDDEPRPETVEMFTTWPGHEAFKRIIGKPHEIRRVTK